MLHHWTFAAEPLEKATGYQANLITAMRRGRGVVLHHRKAGEPFCHGDVSAALLDMAERFVAEVEGTSSPLAVGNAKDARAKLATARECFQAGRAEDGLAALVEALESVATARAFAHGETGQEVERTYRGAMNSMATRMEASLFARLGKDAA